MAKTEKQPSDKKFGPGRSKGGELVPKQRLFVEEYLVDLNATQAAVRAGYSKSTAHAIGWQLLRRPAVAEAIDKALAERPGITRTRIIDELATIGFANMLDFIKVLPDGTACVDLSTLDREKAVAIAELTVDQYTDPIGGEDGRQVKRIKFKLSDKQAALEKIGRTLRMFTDKHELTGKDGEPLAGEASTRDVARAVLDILRTAKTVPGE